MGDFCYTVSMNIIAVIFSIVLAQGAGLVGSVFTVSSIDTWYVTLTQPSFAPPSWVFGPVWVMLYTLMGVAAYLVWRKRKNSTSRMALKVYGAQLVLNALWSIIFFGLHRPDVAFFEIVLLLGCIIWTTVLFWRVDPRASWLMMPYIAWVSFASMLNAAIWVLNASM